MEESDEEWVMVKPVLDKEFNEEAKHWTDAIPIGNGRLGAMVWGAVAVEIINLNYDTLWTVGVPGNYTNPDAPTALMAVRKLVDDDKYAEAIKEAVKLSADPSGVCFLTLHDHIS